MGSIGLGTKGGFIATNTRKARHQLVIHDIRREAASELHDGLAVGPLKHPEEPVLSVLLNMEPVGLSPCYRRRLDKAAIVDIHIDLSTVARRLRRCGCDTGEALGLTDALVGDANQSGDDTFRSRGSWTIEVGPGTPIAAPATGENAA